jgi:Co/Zn/Cd efflux system component
MLKSGCAHGEALSVNEAFMSADCCTQRDYYTKDRQRDKRYRRVLWAVLGVNAAMFLVEIVAGLAVGSVCLQAAALDFLADAGNYGISLFVVGMALRYRARAALAKGATMGLLGLWVIGEIIWHALQGILPDPLTMGAVGFAALAANPAVFTMLWAYRGEDSNMRSVWLCSRNDVIGNLAVLLAALGVFGTSTDWPDVIVAAIIAVLALQGSWQVIRQSIQELRQKTAFDIA